jgi:hypothetical protein
MSSKPKVSAENYFSPMAQQSLVGQGLHIIEG